MRIGQQQLRNLDDPHWLECELKECVILLSWSSVSQADVSRLANLIKQAQKTPGVKREILLSAQSTQKVISEPEFGKGIHDDPAGFYSLENYPDLAANIQIKATKVRKPKLLIYECPGERSLQQTTLSQLLGGFIPAEHVKSRTPFNS